MTQTEFNEKLIDEFRANGGEVTGMFAGRPLLLLTSTGAKTGKSRTTPLVYSKDGDRLVIIASMGGAPKHPAWFLNISANADVVIEVGTEKFNARALTAEEPERGRLFAQQAEMMPAFNEYKEKTTRVIPVVTLARAE